MGISQHTTELQTLYPTHPVRMRSEITAEGKRVTKLDQILLNGNNVALVSIPRTALDEFLALTSVLFLRSLFLEGIQPMTIDCENQGLCF